MKLEQKMDIVLGLTVAILALLIFGFISGSVGTSVSTATGPDAFYLASAKDAKIRKKNFETCIADPKIDRIISDHINEANSLGGGGTPFNVIQGPDGSLVALPGAYPYEAFEDVITRFSNDQITDEDRATVPEGATISPFDIETDYYKGDVDAEITVYEYSDFECPYCARVHPTLQSLVDDHPNVKWVYRNLPLPNHPQAKPAARAALCIGMEKGNDAFWKFTDSIYADQSLLQ